MYLTKKGSNEELNKKLSIISKALDNAQFFSAKKVCSELLEENQNYETKNFLLAVQNHILGCENKENQNYDDANNYFLKSSSILDAIGMKSVSLIEVAMGLIELSEKASKKGNHSKAYDLMNKASKLFKKASAEFRKDEKKELCAQALADYKYYVAWSVVEKARFWKGQDVEKSANYYDIASYLFQKSHEIGKYRARGDSLFYKGYKHYVIAGIKKSNDCCRLLEEARSLFKTAQKYHTEQRYKNMCLAMYYISQGRFLAEKIKNSYPYEKNIEIHEQILTYLNKALEVAPTVEMKQNVFKIKKYWEKVLEMCCNI